VSPRYSLEIQSEPLGCGLAGVLRDRQAALSGILNGVDYDAWDPATDSNLDANYDVDNWKSGKANCKASLQKELGLPVIPDVPLVGLIGRLADQKGWDLVAELMQGWVARRDVQWVILGTGESEYHELLSQLSQRYPEKVAARLEFSDALAHRIEAGSDMFVMASRYEPCGLNQLYSLKYGAVPIVHYTGGLADTITDVDQSDPPGSVSNGFSFDRYDVQHLEYALDRACQMYQEAPDQWDVLVRQGMSQDWSWTRSARLYLALYAEMIVRKGGAAPW